MWRLLIGSVALGRTLCRMAQADRVSGSRSQRECSRRRSGAVHGYVQHLFRPCRCVCSSAVVIGTPYQNIFPLGVGASINALVSTMNTVNTAFLAGSPAFVGGRGETQPDQIGGGVWSRAVVGSVELKSTTSGTVDTSRAAAGRDA